MAVVLAKQISNKLVLSTDGEELGHVYNLTLDAKTAQSKRCSLRLQTPRLPGLSQLTTAGSAFQHAALAI
ncbi:PRC-barrel domain-containing protein (plasmid) [Halorientalis pallida]|uniref:PRC-barrel domain-containing protein n=1 Tax=Halorientalis pallida TaxID=2479928 RepID=UPI003C6FC402